MASCSTYIFDGFNITERLNIVGADNGVSNIELIGHLDSVSRIGTVFKSWADENSVEPYVRADELFWGGRDITINAYVLNTAYSEVFSLNKVLDSIDGEKVLETEFGDFNVTFVSMSETHMQNGISRISMKFRQAELERSGSFPLTESGGYGIDVYSWGDLELIPCRPDNDWGRNNSKVLENSIYGFERNRVKWHEMNTITLNFLVRQPDYGNIQRVVSNLDYLMRSEGKRMLYLRDGSVREVFMATGFKVSGIRITNSECYANISMPVIEIRKLDNIKVWGDSNGDVLGTKNVERLAYTF